MNKPGSRKLDLLKECNDQGVPPREFMGIFCQRCRNNQCVNAGWAESKWEDRMATQVYRLLTNPNFADPNDPAFKGIHQMDFRTVEAPIVLVGGRDPWEGPTVHLAAPDRKTTQVSEVERAIAALSETKGKTPRRAVEASEPVAPPGDPTPRESPPAAPIAPATPQVTAPSPNPPRADPRHYVVDTAERKPPVREANTPFPNEGVMLDGSPPPPVGSSPSLPDPWAPPSSSAPKKVAVGARIRMGGEPPKK